MEKFFIKNPKRKNKKTVDAPQPAYQQMKLDPVGKVINPIEAREVEKRRALLFEAEMQRKQAAQKEADFRFRQLQIKQAAEQAKMSIPQSGASNEVQWNNAGAHKIWNHKTNKEQLDSIENLEAKEQKFQTQKFRAEDIQNNVGSYNFEGIDLSKASENSFNEQTVQNHYHFENTSFDDEDDEIEVVDGITEENMEESYSFESLEINQYALIFKNEIYTIGSKEEIESLIMQIMQSMPAVKGNDLVIVKRVPLKVGICVD